MRQFLGLVVLFLFAMPFGLSVAGCGHKAAVQYCSGNLESGPQVGQVSKITLASALTVTGESLNYGQIGSSLSATAQDCNGANVSVSGYTYNSQDPSIADINPSSGVVCAGTWNRNSGGGIGDFTICTPPAATNTKHQTFVYATANGATSNAIAIYIHAPVTNVQLGATTGTCDTDPDTTCATSQGVTCETSTAGTNPNFPAYDGKSCVSQRDTRQLIARVFDANNRNITCQVGPVTFNLQGASSIAAINAQGFATANLPGSALVTATVSNSSSAVNSGFFSVCPPASIVLSAVNQPANASQINVALNTPQNFTASVLDTNNVVLTGLALEFNSTLPLNFPAASGSVTPVFPGTATITAVCNPGSCNPAPFSQIGVNGNGKPITSNGITVTAAGTSASVLYMASTNSQFIATEDFTTGQLGSPIKLPFVPNSMVISQDGSTLYLGSPQGLMTVATTSNTVTATYTTVQGTVLAVAPNNSYAVVTDPTRQTVSLVTPTGGVFTSNNGIGTRAAWTPDSNTLYVLANTGGVTGQSNQLLTYSTFVGWQVVTPGTPYTDVAVTVPSVGAYFAGAQTDGRSDCSSTIENFATAPPVASNMFYPLADTKAVPTDRLIATTDGKHILGATTTAPAALQDLAITLPTTVVNGTTTIAACPQPNQPQVAPGYFTSTPSTHPLASLTPTAITGVVAASNSGTAFVTYTGTGSVLPLYQPGTGTLTNIPLTGAAMAPVAGVYSSDDTTFYAGTSGDNQVHIISVTGATSKDTGTLSPNLQDPNGNLATPNLIAQRVRRTTS